MNSKVRIVSDKKKLVRKYELYRHELSFLKTRYLEMFECRYGVGTGVPHTFRDCGERFGVTGTRVQQLVARVEYEVTEIEDAMGREKYGKWQKNNMHRQGLDSKKRLL